MILRFLRIFMVGALLAFAVGARAQAQDPKLWYVGAGVGVSWYDDLKLNGPLAGNLSSDVGYTGNVTIGRYLDDIRVIRLELEGLYSRADVNNFAAIKVVTGSVDSASLMINFLYDLKFDSPWVPYLGAGIGYSRVTMDGVKLNGVTVVDDDDFAIAYQVKGGIAYEFNPSMALTVQYRYFVTDNLGFTGSAATPGTVRSGGINSHNAELGFRFNF